MGSTRKNPTRKLTSPPKTPLTPATTAFDRMEKKLEEQRDDIIAQLTAVLTTSEERVMQKISELAAETANLKLSIAAIEKRVTAVENACADVLTLRSELIATKAQLTALENSAVATDLIINGIPQAAGECLPEVFAKVCSVAQHKPPPLRDVFRLRSVKGNGQNSSSACPIVVKLFSANDRNRLLRSVSLFCKNKKRSLALSDIELPGYANIYLHESLSKTQREVMTYASELRRSKRLASAFSIRGRIFVRLKPGDEPKLVSSRAEVNALIGTRT